MVSASLVLALLGIAVFFAPLPMTGLPGILLILAGVVVFVVRHFD